jgi:hypothetical protein
VNSWMVALCSKLENASPSVKLNVGDYNKWANFPLIICH